MILAFDELCNHSGIDEQPVLDYFETNYIGEQRRGRRLPSIFPLELWNMHSRVLSTSIDLGVYHTLKLDVSHNRMLMTQMLAGAPPTTEKGLP